jgi:hypothetical protein
VSHRPKVIGGVTHGRRCCCPACDPSGVLAASIVAEARARPAPPIVPTVAQVLRATSKPGHHGGRIYQMSPVTQRFRELLREGLTAAAAIARIETETKGTP